MMNQKHIVLINDLPSYGKVALAAMVPLLSKMGHYTYQLPTAVISNTLDYGKFHIQDMTDYMKGTIGVWDELGFDPDCICTGFVLSDEQVTLIEEYIKSRSKEKQRLIIVDPIMADGGKLYNGIGVERITAMKKLASYSDVMIPNMTEATFLTGLKEGQESGSKEEVRQLVYELHQISGKSVVITSVVETGTNRHFVCGYDHKEKAYFEVPYEYLPVRIAGSGDIFSTIMTGELLEEKTLQEAVERAVAVLSDLIIKNQAHLDGYKGMIIERYF